MPTAQPADVLFAGVYGHPSDMDSHSWCRHIKNGGVCAGGGYRFAGTLGQADTPGKAIDLAESFSDEVRSFAAGREVATVVNPTLLMFQGGGGPLYSGGSMRLLEDSYVSGLIALAKQEDCYVMLDVQSIDGPGAMSIQSLIDTYTVEDNVFFDLDIEWLYQQRGAIPARIINTWARYYFERRQAAGFTTPGYFAFYIYDLAHIRDPHNIMLDHPDGTIVPIYDGVDSVFSGACGAKVADQRDLVYALDLSNRAYGGMEFHTRFGAIVDCRTAEEYYTMFPGMTFFMSQ